MQLQREAGVSDLFSIQTSAAARSAVGAVAVMRILAIVEYGTHVDVLAPPNDDSMRALPATLPRTPATG